MLRKVLSVEQNKEKISLSTINTSKFENTSNTLPFGSDLYRADILDINGRAVETLINSRINSGFNTTTWNSNNATGIYFLQLVAKDFVSTQKIIHLK